MDQDGESSPFNQSCHFLMQSTVVSTCFLFAGLKPPSRSIGIGPMRPRRIHGFTWLLLSAWACHLRALLPAPRGASRPC